MEEELSNTPPTPAPAADLSVLLISLLKSVLYRDGDERQWAALLNLQARVRDYVAVLNLDLVLDEAEGYAFLKSRPEPTDAGSSPRLPRLVARRPLSFPVSLLLALLRKKLAEFDAGGGDTRLVLGRDDIVELVRVFLPDGPNEAKLIDQIETTINKVAELGFLQKLKPAGGVSAGPASYDVRRILKSFVDAQWLAEFDTRLADYQSQLAGVTNTREGAAND
ncbi:MAG: DUF4194 domain-containing protein [Gammaproteobacteria bacterium]|jgi:hypothetical protein|nr:DUF4194 domain-containing protein [Gammaproteobacteria bacterium]MBP6051574.1 DUF4194 domain-containing protein [Pseudomonadales bacterium]MBK6581339.1 DUF4194 domain-containing protein [Gammaproteobacteria bacterium]MBK7167850.1 DUF4194 domain-containing protein [Gammaproteobacteria bacterium]MBK7518709.1 DUF4194 domain-containing protein [Gammaproteobacteria bacterium]